MAIEFSVVIPTFRRPRELKEATVSVLSQDMVEVELIVVDDSPEGSAHGVNDGLNDDRVTYFKNPAPTGGIPSIVRNPGWRHVRGEFVHFLDDDDIVSPGYYAAVREAFAKHPGIGIVFGRVEPFANCPQAQLDHERRYFADAAIKAARSGRFGSRCAYTGRMLFDKNADWKSVKDRYDVVVVGSGAGGSTLAYQLTKAGLQVLMVEQGEFLQPQWRNASDPVGKYQYHIVNCDRPVQSFVGGQGPTTRLARPEDRSGSSGPEYTQYRRRRLCPSMRDVRD
jgi:glycosyltransferase involved in cell wall biosynthesis